jgi:hypothetical protein
MVITKVNSSNLTPNVYSLPEDSSDQLGHMHSTPQTLIIIDPSVPSYQQLVQGVTIPAHVHILDPDADGVAQMTQLLAQLPNIQTLHVVSHGSPGCLYLGNSQLSADTLERYSWELQSWFNSSTVATSQSSILLYGCSVAAEDAGIELINKLHHFTGASIAASKTPTGHYSLGGNWELDITIGNPQKVSIFHPEAVAAYADILAINLSGPTTSWVAVQPAGTNQFDFIDDEQANNDEGDLVGNSTHPMFYLQFDPVGITSNTDGTLAFRVRIAGDTGSPASGFGRNLFLGVDANGDGRIDLFIGVNRTGSNNQLWILSPGTGTNDSPATTTIDNANPLKTIPIVTTGTGQNFDYREVTNGPTGTDPNATNTNLFGSTPDYFVSFSVPFQDVVNALTSVGITGVTDQSAIRFVIATATQENSLNQDIGGVQGVSSTTTYLESGAITQLIRFDGTTPNNPPSITSSNSANIAENTTNVIDVQSTDDINSEGNGLNYSITGGADAGTFAINPSTGQLSFISAPDFETPTDTDGNNIYIVQVTVTDSGGLSSVQTINVTVTNVNEAPIITSDGGGATASISIAENTTTATNVQSTDDTNSEGNGLVYAITGGADSSQFTIDAVTGQLSFANAPDFQTPTDADGNNIYDVQITVTDAGGLTDIQDISVTVTNVNEAPIITSDGGGTTASISIAENTTSVTDINTTDDANSEGNGLTYTITGGADSSQFTIDAATGQLSFASAPNFEAPADVDGNNIYDVQITVTDAGGLTDVQNISVAVTNINEAPIISAPTSRSVAEDAFITFSGSNLISVADSDNLGGNLQVTLSVNHGKLNLSSVSALTFITGDGIGDAVITFSGTKADINAALNGLRYTDNLNFNGTDQLTISVDDLGNTGSGGSLTDSHIVTITVNPENDAPIRTEVSVALASVEEDTQSPSGQTVSNLFSSAFDDSKDNQTAVSGSAANNLTGIAITANAATSAQGQWQWSTDGTTWNTISPSVSTDAALILSADALIRFLPAPDFNGTPGSLTTRLIDDSAGVATSNSVVNLSTSGGITPYSNSSNAVTLTTSIMSVNDSPTFSSLGDSVEFTENGTVVVLDANAIVNDAELTASNNWNNSVLTLQRQGTANSQDIFANSGNLGTLTQGDAVVVGGISIGTVTTNSDGILVLTFNGNATTALVNSALQQITYQNASNNPPATVAIAYTINDGNIGGQGSGGSQSATGIVTVNITPVNDAPTLDLDGNDSSGILGSNYQTLFAPGESVAIADADTAILDVDSTTIESATITLLNRPNGNSEELLISSALPAGILAGAYDPSTGTLTLTGSASLADYQVAIARVAYANTATVKDQGDRTIQVVVNDGTDDSSPAITTIRFDTDGDGVADADDLDDDNDGIPDVVETNGNPIRDTDGDGILDALDLDSDNDGLSDLFEAGHSALDANNDSRVDNPVGNNGLLDSLETDDTSSATANYSPTDTDGDGTPDFQEIDSDNDGILDSLEAGVDPTNPTDTDSDGTPDFQEIDSDNDGILDTLEAGADPANPTDTDSDGTPDFQEVDSDNDGILDTLEAGADPSNPTDTDSDGTPDFQEVDSDNDGILDTLEAGVDPANPTDTDSDGTPDFQEIDSDNDGILDSLEAGVDPANPTDTDSDGTPDFQEVDSDNDGILDSLEAGVDPANPTDTDSDGTPDFQEVDSDNDGILDTLEAGADPANPTDTDSDGTPDFQEVDSDNDGILDSLEAGADPSNPTDTDSDGTPDFQEIDSDNDGILDSLEAGVDPTNPTDTDSDGTPDFQEVDSDNDGLTDTLEAGTDPANPTDADGDGIYDFQDTDSDNDGNSDASEVGADPANPTDTDGDGIPDYRDDISLADDNQTIEEDAPIPINVLRNDNFSSGSTITGVTDGANGKVILNMDGTITYTPNSDFNGVDSFTYTVTTPIGSTETATVNVTVNPVNDSSILDLDGDDSSGKSGLDYLTGFVEGADPVAIAHSDAVITDVDDTNIESATITLTNRPDGLIESLSVSGTLPTGITASTYDPSTGQITLTGSASLADYQSAIAQVVYNNTSANPNTTDRLVTVVVNDGELDSSIATTTISFTTTNNPATLDLDGNNSSGSSDNNYQTLFTPDKVTAIADVDTTITDVDDINIDSATVTLANRPNGTSEKLLVNGTLPSGITARNYDSLTGRLTLTGSASLANYQAAIASIAYSNTASIKDRSDRTVQVIINDGEDDSTVATTIIRFDTDGDRVGDIDDLDDDNDGIPDALEENGNPNRDTDGDGIIDSLDLDSDNDGIFDIREGGLNTGAIATLDVNNDGVIDSTNPVGTNGLANAIESIPDSSTLNYAIADTDRDGTRDFQDLDSDNDGIPDVIEAGGNDPDQDAIIGNGNIVDRNGNGIADSIDPSLGETPPSIPDRENDGIPDYRDLDSDNDGIFDLTERGGNLPDTNNDGRVDGPDTDRDGLVDIIDGNDNVFGSKTTPISNPQDSNGNGIPDFQELPNPSNGGSSGSDSLQGTSNNDILNGFSDIDYLRGFGGNDIINGGSSGDTLIGDEGNDTLNGGTGNDRMDGGLGDDILNGGSDNDRMWGRDGNDVLEGSKGNDRMWGSNGNDILNGSEGSDRLYGESGKDIVRGSRGKDLIVGGFGKDELTGGQGQDKFVYRSVKDFNDIITDFEIVKDRIDLRRVKGISSMNDLQFMQRGDDTLIKANADNGFKPLAILEDVHADTLASRHFIF